MDSRRHLVAIAALLISSSGIGGFLLGRHLSPTQAYAEEILGLHAVAAGETLMLLRHVEPEDLPRSLRASLVIHQLYLHKAIVDYPEADPELANKALAWIDAYCSDHDCSADGSEVDRYARELLAQYERLATQ